MKTLITIIAAIMLYATSIAQENAPEMVLVEGGTYTMGNEESEYSDEYPAHDVTLSSFYMSKYEISIGLYKKFGAMTGKQIPNGPDNFPAYAMSWNDAIMFCNWLSSVNGKERCYEINREGKYFRATFNPEANGFRLPTEAEWEYAARGGNKTHHYAYSGSENPTEVAWYLQSGNEIKPVGGKKPNELGIYDMSGNLIELCWDNYASDYYSESPEDNPTGPANGSTKVARGGSYYGSAETLRVSKRFPFAPDQNDKTLGMRLVRNAD
jgi:formylglycine-generating enzyme